MSLNPHAMTTASQTFRIPRGLWADLEESVISHDRRFLTDIAKELGLPVADVLRRCLGTGVRQSIPVIWTPPDEEPCTEACPWMDCYGVGLWRQCSRLRLSATLPCYFHEKCHPNEHTRLKTDPFFRTLPTVFPIIYGEKLYWFDPADTTGTTPVYREDGTLELEGRFRKIHVNGDTVFAWINLKPRSIK